MKSPSQLKTYLREYNRTRKEKVIRHYTQGRCQCQCPGCKVKGTEFLVIDHVNEDGAIQRRKYGLAAGIQTIGWLIKNNYPCGIQILCHNCNAAKSYYGRGTCPHVTKMKEILQ